MSKIVFEVPQKNGSFVTARIGSRNHTEDTHASLTEMAIGGVLFLIAVGFVLFLISM